MRETQYLRQVMLGKLDDQMYIKKVRTHPHTIHKINLKWHKSLSIRHKTPRREHRQNILWHKLYQCFLKSVYQAIKIKAKKNET